jgi:hypothetical protein
MKLRKVSSFRVAAWALLIFIAAVFLAYALGWLESESAKLGVELLTALLAAYFGASAAMIHQSEKDVEDRADSDVAAINQMIFSLVVRRGWLKVIWREIASLENSSSRHLELRSAITVQPRQEIQVSDLRGLLISSEGNIVLRLAIEDLQFNSIVKYLQARDSMHEEFQRKVGQSNTEMSGVLTRDRITELGLWDLFARLKDVTDSIYKFVPEAIAEHEKLIDDVRVVARGRYPGRTFISVKWSEPE